jgi:hypothetical protein
MLSLLLPALCSPSTANAQEAPAPAAAAPKPFEASGQYVVMGLNQRNFLLGAADTANPDGDKTLDDADLVVQLLRLSAKANREHYGVVARMDLAQGWWGVDNSPNTSTTATSDGAGGVVSSTTNNSDKLFGSKDTNYSVHVDLAYAWFELGGTALRVQAGRQEFRLGQMLLLDANLDGLQVRLQPGEVVGAELWWAKMSEGAGSSITPTGAVMDDGDPYGDADLFAGTLRATGKPGKVELFGAWYQDNSQVDATTGDATGAYLPDGLAYAEARYRPQVTSMLALGLSGDAKLPVGDGLTLKAEVDYLSGTDDVDNADHSSGKLDMNNGTLRGWNAYVNAEQAVEAAIPLRFGALFGIGSGDPDVTKGEGNLNRIQTWGFFDLTNVWEDSVMPDIEGISPQGLGSPVSRGYRELENTTAAQGRFGLKPHEKLDVEASYTFLRATQPIVGFDATGVPGGKSSQDLGQEVDLDVGLTIWKGLSYKVEGGVFLPGDAAGLLINGTTDALDPAFEVKQVLAARF